ncbi:MAG: hypothetical protein JW395_1607 [Nitrospira sp.]|nr:hypothetical protein [Nitrospira sp.]
METQESRRLQHDCRTDQPGGAQEESTKTGDEAVASTQIRRPLSRTIEDQELMLNENGLGDHGTNAARPQEPTKSSQHMDKKDDKIAHPSILAKPAIPMNCFPK